tara:strand:- start:16969 stop:18786 length:1818 start_codon:yes stop_codon:yes gene_type:complete
MLLGVRGRLILGTTTLIVAFVAVAVVVFAIRADSFADGELARNVAAGRESLRATISQRRGALLDQTRFLADTPLLLALATIPGVDQATLEDGFDEIQRNFAAPLLAVVNTDGEILGCRGSGWSPGQGLAEQRGMAAALRGEASEHIWPHQRGLVMVGMAPLIQSDVVYGVLVRGERIDRSTAESIGRIVGRDLILMHAGQKLGESWHAQPSDLLATNDLARLQHASLPPNGQTVVITANGHQTSGLAVQLHPDAGIAFLTHDVDVILQLRDQALSFLVLAGLLVTMVGIWFATRTAGKLTKPLHLLMDASNRLREGELSTRVRVQTEDELGRLALSFNSMAETLQNLVSEVTEKAANAEAASRAKDGFLMSISHELRTPLCGIQSTAELLQQFGGDVSDEERQEFLATILTESERLGRRISDALEFASLTSDRTTWTVSRVDLVAACSEARSRVSSLKALKHVDLHIQRDVTLTLRGDRERIVEALYHLMHNAWQWSPPNSVVDISLGSGGESVWIGVEDRGPGIRQDDLDAVFDSFRQGGEVLTDKPQGIGIGIKIAREVAIAHGGSVDYEDREGGGARFLLRLRRANRPIDETAAEFAPEAQA